MGAKVTKTITLLRKLQPRQLSLRNAFIAVSKVFICPYLDCGDIFYDKAFNASFHHKIESVQYKAYLAITSAWGSSKEKKCQELGLGSLQQRRRYRKLCYFYKI